MKFHKDSPDYYFHPSSVGWLQLKNGRNELVLNSDLIRIIENDGDLIPDDTLRLLILAGLRGELKAKRGPKRAPDHKVREARAVNLYEGLLPELQKLEQQRKQQGIKKPRGALSPSEEACELIADKLGFATGEAVRNIVSRVRQVEKAHKESQVNYVRAFTPDS